MISDTVIERFANAMTHNRITLIALLEVLYPKGGWLTKVIGRIKQDT